MTVFPHERTAARVMLRANLADYWTLIKSPQTGLLVTTGIAGFVSALPGAASPAMLAALALSLSLAVGGSTVLNMGYDRDIDARMTRTARRPLPAGRLDPRSVSGIGLFLVTLGITWAWVLSPLYALVVSAGVMLDVVVYTMWLKRRTPWSIVLGGLAGGMPALAGRVLAIGGIDLLGVLLALAVLLWIPTHMMTFGIKYADDYRHAGVPVFANVYGPTFTRYLIAAASIAEVGVMLCAEVLLGVSRLAFGMALLLGGILVLWAIAALLQPTSRSDFFLYKLASIYMLGSMVLLIIAA